jgi:hypothetical protein
MGRTDEMIDVVCGLVIGLLMRIDQILYSDMHICMDWRSVKFDWNKARAVTAERSLLSAASAHWAWQLTLSSG